MLGVDLFLNYIQQSSFVTIVILSWLSIYFILSFTILFSRMSVISIAKRKEQNSLEDLLMGSKSVDSESVLSRCCVGAPSKQKLNICVAMAEKNATSGLTWLSIIASTSPFIGLFGTVVSILETFSALGGNSASSSLSVIAPAISEALVATAAGIFVAIPAYTFNLIIKRKAYEFMNIVEHEVDVIMSAQEERV